MKAKEERQRKREEVKYYIAEISHENDTHVLEVGEKILVGHGHRVVKFIDAAIN